MEKLKNMRIQKRLIRSFILTTAITGFSAVIAVIALLIISNRYTYALNNYVFSQGDIGKAMIMFTDVRNATRGVIGYDDAEILDYR